MGKAWEESSNNIDIVFAIDSSGSMITNDLNELSKQPPINFVEKLTENDRVAVIDFDSNGNIVVHLTNNQGEIKVGIERRDASGGIDLYDGMNTALRELNDHDYPGNKNEK